METVPYINNSFREEVQSDIQAATFLRQFKWMTVTSTPWSRSMLRLAVVVGVNDCHVHPLVEVHAPASCGRGLEVWLSRPPPGRGPCSG